MNSYFLDTSVVIDCIRGKKETVKFISDLKASLYINYIVIAELSEGIYRVKDSKSIEVGIDAFINGMDGVFPINYNVSKLFGKIRADLKEKGQIIEDFDILIGATCIENNIPIITLNRKHFDKIQGLEVFTPDDLKN
ncbi:MAG: type II toxin-antitoxin system VapC family toxin [Patescibacteria group bacterium]